MRKVVFAVQKREAIGRIMPLANFFSASPMALIRNLTRM